MLCKLTRVAQGENGFMRSIHTGTVEVAARPPVPCDLHHGGSMTVPPSALSSSTRHRAAPHAPAPTAALACALLAALAFGGCGSADDTGNGRGAGITLPDGNSGALFDASGGGGADATTSTDVNLDCPGGALCPCKTNDDCDNNLCIEGLDGNVCAKPCLTECPSGYKCSNVSVPGGDVTTICTLAWGRLCDPCNQSEDCAALGITDAACVDHGAGGLFCGSPCAADSDCPTTHRCAEVKTAEGAQRKQCLPKKAADGTDPGACTCSKRAQNLGLKTVCSVDNIGPGGKVIGTCIGERSCSVNGAGGAGDPGGLSPCEVPQNSKEICDGLDNDCDGKTDDDACDDTNPCTQDLCDPKKAVDGKDGCSHTTAALPCDADGSACTENDVCKDGVCKPGGVKDCDDKNPCTLDTCDPSSGCVKKDDDGKPCDDDNPCTVGDACATGQCTGGQPKLCKSGDPCVDAKCLITSGKCDYGNKTEGAPCDDGSACTTGETCVKGSCGGTPISCDDQNSCTLDTCDPAKGCGHAAGGDGTKCDDGNGCTKGGGCKAGVCIGGTPVKCDDGDPCTNDSCNQATNTCVYAAKAGCGGWCAQGSDCKDDGNACTTMTCAAPTGGATLGKCQATPNSASCDDGNACTTGDVCSGGVCKGNGKDCDDKNACTTDTCDPVTKACKSTPNTAACDDGNVCTTSDACSAGVCKAGTAVCKLGDPCKGAGDCAQGACIGGKCTQVASCGFLGKGSSGALGDVVLSGAVAINTSTGSITGGGKTIVAGGAAGTEVFTQQSGGAGAPKVRVFHFGNLTVALNATVTVTGQYGLALLAKSTFSMAGTIAAGGGGGAAGGTNTGGKGGGAGPGGAAGGTWVSGPGCVSTNGKGLGTGGGQRGACGGGGGKGGDGSNGGGGGGGGGGCGGTGGPGGSFGTPGESGYAGEKAGTAVNGQGFGSAIPGAAGTSCGQPSGNTGPAVPYGDGTGKSMLGGSGGAGGGFGGFAGFGGGAKGPSGSAYGGQPGFSGGSAGGGGGGGAVMLCAGGELLISGTVDASGGLGAPGGSSGFSASGQAPSFSAKAPVGAGGGGGRSGGGGGGGGGSGGAIFLIAPQIKANSGVLKAGGGLGGSPGFAFSGGSGGYSSKGSNGGAGASGGKGGKGGKGGDGRIRVQANSAALGSYTGQLTQGGL